MWPDVGIKSSPILSKVAQKVATEDVTYKVPVFNVSPKVANICPNF